MGPAKAPRGCDSGKSREDWKQVVRGLRGRGGCFSSERGRKFVRERSGSESGALRTIIDCCFCESWLEECIAPENLRKIGDGQCGVVGVFAGSAIEEIILPGALQELEKDVFLRCSALRVVYTEYWYEADLSRSNASDSA